MRSSQKGFTYMAVLFAVAIIGASLALIGVTWKTAQQRENEKELLFIGDQFRKAIGLYYERTPGPIKKFPENLEQLIKDDRYIVPQHYLRKIYRDPMTNKTDWEIIVAPNGGIMGVHSASDKAPHKQSNFKEIDATFKKSKHYSSWKFFYAPYQPVTTRNIVKN